MADKIVGPLTLRHMIIIGAGGGLAYLIYVILARTYYWEIWFPPVFIISLITLAAAFLRIYNVSFGKFLILLLESFLIPRKRVWRKADAEVLITGVLEQTKNKKNRRNKDKEEKAAQTIKKIKNISDILDNYGKDLPNQ
ncbi:PrgI family protein [bacterium]|nr:PrgI family protein [bacterium]